MVSSNAQPMRTLTFRQSAGCGGVEANDSVDAGDSDLGEMAAGNGQAGICAATGFFGVAGAAFTKGLKLPACGIAEGFAIFTEGTFNGAGAEAGGKLANDTSGGDAGASAGFRSRQSAANSISIPGLASFTWQEQLLDKK